MARDSISDIQILFATVLGVAVVVAVQELLVMLVSWNGVAEPELSLLAQMGPATIMRAFSVFFVLLPVGLAFVCIGIPFALISIARLFRREASREDFVALAALGGAIVTATVEFQFGGNGMISLLAVIGVCLWQTWGPTLRFAARQRFRLFFIGGLSLAGLAYYEHGFLSGEEKSVAIAPTFLLVAFFALAVAVFASSIAATSKEVRGRITALLCVVLTMGWCAAPALRDRAFVSGGGDHVEMAITVAAAVAISTLSLYGAMMDWRGKAAP